MYFLKKLVCKILFIFNLHVIKMLEISCIVQCKAIFV